jgi:hypothetical protein
MLYQPVHDIRTPDGRRARCLQELLGVEATLYDPGWRLYSEKPVGVFDIVVCTDVLEHCDEADLGWIVGELFTYARHYLFANVACYPARKRLPSGENAHITIRPVEWWQSLFAGVAAARPDVDWQVICTAYEDGERRNFTFGSAAMA